VKVKEIMNKNPAIVPPGYPDESPECAIEENDSKNRGYRPVH
jgi:hypothetical protein